MTDKQPIDQAAEDAITFMVAQWRADEEKWEDLERRRRGDKGKVRR